jgi:inhibitor of cysteine peptidase
MRLLLLCLAFSLTACSATKPVVQKLPATEQDNNRALNVVVGQRFVVRLSENPTTGYVWVVDGQPALFVLQSSDYVADAQPNSQGKALVGGGGQRSFAFVAKKVGTATLKLKQWRPWQGDSSIVDTFSIDVQVNAK